MREHKTLDFMAKLCYTSGIIKDSPMSFDFYHHYSEQYRKVYGISPCSREEWTTWCKQPANAEVRDPLGYDFDIETERRDGWTYQELG